METPARSQARPMRLAHIVPLLTFLVPTIVIGYGFVIPGSCIAGVNEHTIGFASSLVAASVTYVVGVRQALRS
jgi:ABC-type Fe3+ transport system permease subunit